MPAAQKIIPSGLHPAADPSLESKVLGYTEEICAAFIAAVQASLLKIQEAERNAITRLNEYVPTEPLMNRTQAAAYLKLKLRQFDLLSSPSNPQIPYVKIGGQKRFRKVSIDGWLDGIEIKKRAVRL